MRHRDHIRSVRISLIYALVTGLWIILSDRVLSLITDDPDRLSDLQTFKGLVFIAATTLLIYGLLRQELHFQGRLNADLMASEERWRAIMNHIPDALYVVSREGNIIFTNQPHPHQPPGQEYTGTIYDYIATQEHNTIRQALELVFEHGKPTGYEMLCENPDQRAMWSAARMGPIKQQDQITAAVLVARDITQAKRTEQALRRNETQLLRAQAVAHVGNWELDLTTQQVSASEEARRIYGLGDHNLTITVIQSVPLPQYRPLLDEALQALIKQNRPYDLEFKIQRPADGEVVVIHSVAEYDPDTRTVIGTIQDITDRKRNEDLLRKLMTELDQRVSERTAQLEIANKELEAFAYSVSHDLRAPLRAIDGFSRIVQEEYTSVLGDEGNRLLDIVRANVRQMDKLITSLLTLSRTARSEITPAVIDMAAMAHSVFDDIATTEDRQSFTLTIEPLPTVMADTVLMRQVWTNVLSNAIKYTRPKDERCIKITGHVDHNTVVYCVTDSGVGFNPKFTDKLFGVFQRLHSVEDFEGTGVGLAIVQRIIQRHRGRVWAEAELDQGASFYFALPNHLPTANSGQSSHDSQEDVLADNTPNVVE